MKARPHSGPLPQGEGETSSARVQSSRKKLSGTSRRATNPLISTGLQPGVGRANGSGAVSTASCANGEAAEAAEDVLSAEYTRLKPGANERCNDFLLWQLADSAFPTGGFAHSAGLEAAWQHGEVRNRSEFREWLAVSLNQVTHAALPLVNTAHAEPDRLEELDRLCDAFTSNHVANRASRLQGRALLVAVGRIFPEQALQNASTSNGHRTLKWPEGRAPSPPFAHLSPVFGAVTSSLGISKDESIRLFVFMHLRSALAAAVRLNIVGPMEGQAIQFQLSGQAEAVALHGAALTLDDLAQTAPLCLRAGRSVRGRAGARALCAVARATPRAPARSRRERSGALRAARCAGRGVAHQFVSTRSAARRAGRCCRR